ncbi:MAG: type I restriction endonuclease [Brevundimonas sp.]|uniref:type I restriction endonuclease n=1 Tax=Brevundimonas sp. TaxID=1871086 RepID=UPI00391B517B
MLDAEPDPARRELIGRWEAMREQAWRDHLAANGLPLAVLELKNAAAENATTTDAFNQFQTYLTQAPGLFRTNAVLVASGGLGADRLADR